MTDKEIRRRMVDDCCSFNPQTDDKYDLYQKGVRLGEQALLDVVKQFLRRKAKSFGHAEFINNSGTKYHYDTKKLIEALEKYVEQH